LLQFFHRFALFSLKISLDVFLGCGGLLNGGGGSTSMLAFALIASASVLL
jgi:hypothetical protein